MESLERPPQILPRLPPFDEWYEASGRLRTDVFETLVEGLPYTYIALNLLPWETHMQIYDVYHQRRNGVKKKMPDHTYK